MNKAMIADSGEKTWLTPRYIIDALGHFDTDPCCLKVMPWRTADRMLTKEDDGTIAPWHGRIWLNPPYGKESVPFLDRMAHHAGGGIALLFARTNTRTWHELVFPFAHSILFMQGQIRFCKPDGSNGKFWAVAPSAFVSYSKYDTNILASCGIRGTLVRMKGNACERSH